LLDVIAVVDDVEAISGRITDVAEANTITITDLVLAENINVDVTILEIAVAVLDVVLTTTISQRTLDDTIAVADQVTGEKGGVVDRIASDAISVIDTSKYLLLPGAINDTIALADNVEVARITPLPVDMDADGFGMTVELPSEIRYDYLQAPEAFRF